MFPLPWMVTFTGPGMGMWLPLWRSVIQPSIGQRDLAKECRTISGIYDLCLSSLKKYHSILCWGQDWPSCQNWAPSTFLPANGMHRSWRGWGPRGQLSPETTHLVLELLKKGEAASPFNWQLALFHSPAPCQSCCVSQAVEHLPCRVTSEEGAGAALAGGVGGPSSSGPQLGGPGSSGWWRARPWWPSRFGNVLTSDIFQTVTFRGGETASGLRSHILFDPRTAGLSVTPGDLLRVHCTCCVEWSRCLGLSARLGWRGPSHSGSSGLSPLPALLTPLGLLHFLCPVGLGPACPESSPLPMAFDQCPLCLFEPRSQSLPTQTKRGVRKWRGQGPSSLPVPHTLVPGLCYLLCHFFSQHLLDMASTGPHFFFFFFRYKV